MEDTQITVERESACMRLTVKIKNKRDVLASSGDSRTLDANKLRGEEKESKINERS